MATVRISNQLRYEVQAKIRELFAAREKAAETALAAVNVGHEVIQGTLPKAQLEAAITLNNKECWIALHNSISVTVRFEDHKGTQQKRVFRTTICPALPLPVALTTYYCPDIELTSAMPSYEKVAAIARSIYQIQDDCQELQSAVSKILGQCTTLRQVLEIWPSALEYMPPEVRRRHAAKTEKREATVIDEVEDSTKTLLMKARLLANPN